MRLQLDEPSLYLAERNQDRTVDAYQIVLLLLAAIDQQKVRPRLLQRSAFRLTAK